MQALHQRATTIAQRIGAAVLLFVCLLPLLASIAGLSGTLGTDAEAALPACCRAHGKHHCSLPPASTDAPLLTAHVAEITSQCLLYPHASAWPGNRSATNRDTLSLYPANATSYLVTIQISSLGLRFLAADHRKRGPPNVLSS